MNPRTTLLLLLACSCAYDPLGPSIGVVADGGDGDAGLVDSGFQDAGNVDSGEVDAGLPAVQVVWNRECPPGPVSAADAGVTLACAGLATMALPTNDGTTRLLEAGFGARIRQCNGGTCVTGGLGP